MNILNITSKQVKNVKIHRYIGLPSDFEVICNGEKIWIKLGTKLYGELIRCKTWDEAITVLVYRNKIKIDNNAKFSHIADL